MNEKASAQAFRNFSKSKVGYLATGAVAGVAAGSAAHAAESSSHRENSAETSPTTNNVPSDRGASQSASASAEGKAAATPPASQSTPQEQRIQPPRDYGWNGNNSRNGGDRVVIVHDHSNNDNGFMSGVIAGSMLEAASNHDSSSRPVSQQPDPNPQSGNSHVNAAPSGVPSAALSSQSPGPNVDHGHWGMILFLILAISFSFWMFLRAAKRRSGISSVGSALKNAAARGMGADGVASTSAVAVEPLIPSLPRLIVGAGITVPGMATSSDPTSDQPELDFEPDQIGAVSISAVGTFSRSEDTATLYTTHDLSDHVSICFDPQDNGKILDAVFFSEVARYANSEPEWDVWLNAENGLMGQPDIEHGGKKWKRSILPQDETRLEPVVEHEHIHCMRASGEQVTTSWRHQYTLYERETGYSSGYPVTEYMMIRATSSEDSSDITFLQMTSSEDSGDIMFLQILGGVPVPVSSLNLA